MSLGDSRVDVDLNPSGAPRIANIERRTVDLIDAVEAIGGENSPSNIARLKTLATADVQASTVRASKAATQSRRRTTRFVTGRLADPTPRREALRATPANRLDGCSSRDPKTTRRRVAPRSKTGAQLTSPTSSPCHTGRARAPDAAARWRRSPDPHAASRRPHPRLPRRPYAALLRAHIGASRDPVTVPLPRNVRPPNTAAPQYPCKSALGPLHAHPQFARAELSSTPRTPLQDPKVLLTRPLPHAQTRQRCVCSPCAPRAACAAASASRPQDVVCRAFHNRGTRLSD